MWKMDKLSGDSKTLATFLCCKWMPGDNSSFRQRQKTHYRQWQRLMDSLAWIATLLQPHKHRHNQHILYHKLNIKVCYVTVIVIKQKAFSKSLRLHFWRSLPSNQHQITLMRPKTSTYKSTSRAVYLKHAQSSAITPFTQTNKSSYRHFNLTAPLTRAKPSVHHFCALFTFQRLFFFIRLVNYSASFSQIKMFLWRTGDDCQAVDNSEDDLNEALSALEKEMLWNPPEQLH